MNDERRFELHDLNTRAWNGESVFPLKTAKLDSSIKRNTGFIKKLKKGITKDTKDSLLKDLSEVSLEKYLSEIISTVNESLSNSSKLENIEATVEIVSALHQRFNIDFTSRLFELFIATFVNPSVTENDNESQKEEHLRLARLKNRLTILTELYLVGVFTSLDIIESRENIPMYIQRKISRREPYIFTVLKEMLNYKFKLGYTTIIATTFLKRYPILLTDDHSWDSIIYDENLKSLLNNLFKIFADAVLNKTVELDKRIHKLKKEHQKCQIRTGKLVDEYIEEHDYLFPIFERFRDASTVFMEFFDLDQIELIDEDNENDDNEAPMITNQVLPPNERLWENDETKRFYENLPDIEEIVRQSKSEDVSNNFDDINKFFEELELADTKDAIDNLVQIYWKSNLDNKATRNRLLKYFIENQDWGKIRIYARFLAANKNYFPEIIEEFIKCLDNGFRSQLHSNKINVKNVLFFAETVKFMLVPSFMIFHKIRTLIINLQIPNNIEILTIFFEHAGKFLVNKEEYKEDMDKMVHLLKSKTRDRQLSINLKSAVENTLALLFPPSVQSLNIEERVLSNEERFYHILIRSELSNFKHSEAVSLLRKANWKDKNVYETLFVLFTETDKMNYQNIPSLAKIMRSLYPYYRNFVIRVVDQTLENIDRGLETNDYSENMSRIAHVRFLTEIFNTEMIKSDVLLNCIYQIIRFGHYNNQPNPAHTNPLDLPDNYFRIQLVTTMLLNITRFPTALTAKLEALLRFFEYYTFTKQQPLPIETQFKIKDTYAKFSKNTEFEESINLIESVMRLRSIIESSQSITSVGGKNSGTQVSNSNTQGEKKNNLEDEDEEEEENDEPKYDEIDEDDMDDYGIETETKLEHISTSESDSTSEGDSDSNEDETDADDDEDDEEDEEIESDSDDEFRDLEADRNAELQTIYNEFEQKIKSTEEQKVEDELEKQYQQMMEESLRERKSEKTFTSALPVIAGQSIPIERSNLANLENTEGSAKKVAFTFLTKNGKKTNSRTLALPDDVKFVSGVLQQEQQLRNEREKIKNIVLQRSFD